MRSLPSHKWRNQRGQAMITATIFLLVISLTIIFGVSNVIVRQVRVASNAFDSRASYFVAEAGVEDMAYRMKNSMNAPSVSTLSLDGSTAAITISDTADGKEIRSVGDANDSIRISFMRLDIGSGASFHYGIQSHTGGIILENFSSVQGNVFSNGPIISSNNARIYGDVVSAGPDGLIDGAVATGTAWAHTIENADIEKDAYYEVISNTVVGGTLYPNSPDQPTSTLPITDELVDEWKADALDGGVIDSPCPYQITDTATIGPIKIDCDLEINGNNYTVTIAGNVWVSGDITINNSPHIRIDPSLGNKSVAIVADNESDRSSSSRVLLKNSATFEGSGNSKSLVLFVSQNDSAENGGGTTAIDVDNSIEGDLLVYAGHGEIRLGNSISLKEVSAFRIRLQNSAEVIYSTGLVSLLFESGPGGSYQILDWRETE